MYLAKKMQHLQTGQAAECAHCHKFGCCEDTNKLKAYHDSPDKNKWVSIDSDASSLNEVPLLNSAASKDNKEFTVFTLVSNPGFSGQRYSQFCSCPGIDCKCSSREFSVWQKVLPRNSQHWPHMKLTCLIIAGSLPWIFLIIYMILHYTT